MKKCFILLISLFFVFGYLVCNADLEGYTINSYNSEYILHENGVLSVKEMINVNFNENRHGIYRSIPYKYSNNYETPIRNIKVLGDKFSTYGEGKNLIIKIGDKDRTIFGNHLYTLNYDIIGTVRAFSGYQELYRNLLGYEWNTKVNNYNFYLALPENLQVAKEDIVIYYGEKGSKDTLDATLSGNIISIPSSINLNERESVTIVVKFKPDTFEVTASNNRISLNNMISNITGYLPYNFIHMIKSFFMVILAIIMVLCMGTTISLPPMHIKKKWKNIRDVIHYDPPKGYSASEICLLYKRYPDTETFVNTVIYERINDGLLIPKIKKRFFGLKKKTVYEVVKLEAGKRFKEILDKGSLEGKLWNSIIPYNLGDITSKHLKKEFENLNTISYKMFKKLRDELTEGNYNRNFNVEYLEVPLWFFTLWGVFCIIGYQNTSSLILTIGSFIVLFFVFFGIVHGIRYYRAFMEQSKTPDEEHLTMKGKEVIEQIHGYRKFLLQVENERLNTLINEDPQYCEKILPYAIALGIGDKWVKKCKLFGKEFKIDTINYDVSGSSRDSTPSLIALSGISFNFDASGSGGGGSDWGSSSGSSSGSSGGGGGGGGGGSW